MKITFFFAAALVASVSATDIKEKLRQFRDPENVDTEKVYKFLNDRHERRMEKLEELLVDRKQQLNDHEKGHRKLSTDDHARVTRQSVNFQRKLSQLKNTDPEDHADMMQKEAESLYKMNSVDYLDFELKN